MVTPSPYSTGVGEERRRRGWGGGAGRRTWVSLAAGAGGVGGPAEGHGYPCEGTGGVSGYPLPKAREGWGGEDMWDLGSVRDRGGGTSSPSPSAPPPVAISPRSSARGDPGEKPGTAAPLISQALPTPPGRGRGRSAEGAGGVGVPEKCMGISCRRCGWGGGAGKSAWVACRRKRGRGGGRQRMYGQPACEKLPARWAFKKRGMLTRRRRR